jgi:hypothetical protein
MDQMAVDRNGPQAFILAPDSGRSAYHPENDQIWGLCLEASQTCPFYLHTTYQLRARSMRVFPNIIIGHHALTQTGDFRRLPTVTQYTPSYVEIQTEFTGGLHARFTAYLPEPDALVGTLEIQHSSPEPIRLACELGALLIPMGKGRPTQPMVIGGNHILEGQTEDIAPVLFMSSGPQGTSSPHPALRLSLTLDPGESKQLHWALVSKSSQQASLEAARHLAAPAWHKGAHTHIKDHQKQLIRTQTGESEWDAAFYFAQVNALTHLVNLGQGDLQGAFVRTRLPDQPPQRLGQTEVGSDLTLLDTLHLAEVLLPAHANQLAGLIDQFTARVDGQGCLPSNLHRTKSGGSIRESPLLASLYLACYEITADSGVLNQAYPHLSRFFEFGWWAGADRDPVDFPHWERPAQLQLQRGLFNFEALEDVGNGLDIRTAESPALAAMLYREALALQKIARILGDRAGRIKFGKAAKIIMEKMRTMWDNDRKIFTYLDRESHCAPDRELYYPGRIQPNLDIQKRFNQPQRLQIHLTARNQHNRDCVIRITGENLRGERIVEVIQPPHLRWLEEQAQITTQHLYTALKSVAFEGFNPDDHFLIKTADYTQADVTCLLPIWSGGASNEHITALLETHLDWQSPDLSAGIPETWRSDHPLPEGLPVQANILWNTLIINGIVNAGYSEVALGIFSNLMSTIIQGLKDFNGFFPAYTVENGLPAGKANSITGLAPLQLFLKIAGIKLISPEKVAIWGSNPFPWPVSVSWQGLWLRRDGLHTHIIFPDGTQYQSEVTKPLVITGTERQIGP